MDCIRLKIVSPSGVLLERDVRSVRLPTPEGSVGVLADHAPMLCAVGKGEIRFRFEGGEDSLSVAGGIACVEDNLLTVLADGRAEEA